MIAPLVNRYFGDAIMDGLATFIWNIIANNWQNIYKIGSPVAIAKFITHEIFEGIRYLFTKTRSKITQNTRIKPTESTVHSKIRHRKIKT